MKSACTRLALVVTLSIVALLGSALPAGASTGVVLADARFKWFYWLGIFIALNIVLFMLVLSVLYVVRVMRPKWRGRPQS